MNSQEGQESQENLNTQPINYETKKEQNGRLGVNKKPNKDYYQSNEKGIATDGKENNVFVTKEAREISQLLAKREYINQIQVATMDERVVVSVTLNDYTLSNAAGMIKRDVEKVVPNKEIIVYTDELHWNRMKDVNASLKQREIGENVEEYLEKHLNINVED